MSIQPQSDSGRVAIFSSPARMLSRIQLDCVLRQAL
jgi:hypothetical protein